MDEPTCDEWLPAGEVLNGLELCNLPEGFVPVEATLLIKCMDEDGQDRWLLRSTDGLGVVEMLGAARGLVLQAEKQYLGMWG